MDSAAAGSPVRRKKSALERRQQRRRAEARTMQKLLLGFHELSSHRGCQLSQLGSALQVALLDAQQVATPADTGMQVASAIHTEGPSVTIGQVGAGVPGHLFSSSGTNSIDVSVTGPVDGLVKVGDSDCNVGLEIDAESTRSTAVSVVLDSAFRQLQSMCLDLPARSGWEHSGVSAFLSPAASSNQVDFVKTMTNIETHLVHLFADFCRIRSYDTPLLSFPSSRSDILPSCGGPGEVVWHNPFVSDITLYYSDLQTMKLKQYDCTTFGLKFRSNSTKQKERVVAFQEMLLTFSKRSRL